jgi:hypothetical protein
MVAKETKINGKKEYLIAYHFFTKDGRTGVGELISYIDNNIKIDSNVIQNWKEFLKETNGFKNTVILNVMNLDNL